MNDKQKAWTQSKCDGLKQYIDQYSPLSEEQWESVADYIEKVVSLSKDNAEVRNALFDTIEPYQKRAEKELLSA